ncbi:MAG: PilZ domain-containing protein [Myxococcales bacterium]|nr:PilZ domain-containing protein [Myxococcales bacterium]
MSERRSGPRKVGEATERRAVDRVSADEVCSLELLDAVPWVAQTANPAISHELEGRVLQALMVDLSAAGAGLRTADPPSLGSRLLLRFERFSAGALAVCTVRWREPAPPLGSLSRWARFGVVFDSLNAAASRTLQELMAWSAVS